MTARIVWWLDDKSHALGLNIGWLCDWNERLIWRGFKGVDL